ncbi:hypothetical protein H1C71_041984, partial [Ictidomys tridecemlineatus]
RRRRRRGKDVLAWNLITFYNLNLESAKVTCTEFWLVNSLTKAHRMVTRGGNLDSQSVDVTLNIEPGDRDVQVRAQVAIFEEIQTAPDGMGGTWSFKTIGLAYFFKVNRE